MIADIRQEFNAAFTLEKYQHLLADMAGQLGEAVDFRVAESPFFVPDILRDRLLTACEDIAATIGTPDYYKLSERAIPAHQRVPGDDARPTMLVADFAVCMDEKGEPMPQLIEMQGFPSLFAYQILLAEAYKKHFDTPAVFDAYLNGYNSTTFGQLLREMILGTYPAENVILLEIEPEKQKTRADFSATQQLCGIVPVCLSKIIREKRKLYYLLNGEKTPIHRIYNRVIFDELEQRTDLKLSFSMLEEVDVEWVCHPNWFFRMSKYSMPFFKSPFIPETHFVHQLSSLPADLENWVLKPLYSFAGMGVNVHVTPEDITALEDPSHYILQKKVQYAPVLAAPQAAVKVEIRMMMFWPTHREKPEVVTNLCRLSRGELIGVRYNKDFDWVGGSSAFFRQSTV